MGSRRPYRLIGAHCVLLTLVLLAGVSTITAAQDYAFVRKWPGVIFSAPCSVAIDAAGNVFVADMGSHCIQEYVPKKPEDIDGNSLVDAVDVQRVINAALGL